MTSSYFVSWSGGKDCCLALFRAMQQFGKPACLLNMLTEDGIRSRSHGLTKACLVKQAEALQIPIQFHAATWQTYETVFAQALGQLRLAGITSGIFGDIKMPHHPNWHAHRDWADKLCRQANMHASEPLWEDSIENIFNDFFTAGFIAKIIAVNAAKLSADYLGYTLTPALINEFTAAGIDPAGELGEYHTIVVDGPIFHQPLSLIEKNRVLRDGYWFLDVG